MKKLICIPLLLCLTLSLAACSNPQQSTSFPPITPEMRLQEDGIEIGHEHHGQAGDVFARSLHEYHSRSDDPEVHDFAVYKTYECLLCDIEYAVFDENAATTYPHAWENGACTLCGYEQ